MPKYVFVFFQMLRGRSFQASVGRLAALKPGILVKDHNLSLTVTSLLQQASLVCVRVCVWVRCSCRVMLAHHLTSTPPTLLIIHCVMYSDTCKHTISQCTSTCTLTKQRPLPSHPITFLCRSVLTLCWELSTCSGNRASRWITLLQLFFSLIFLLRSVCLEMFLVKLSFPFLSLSTLPIPSLSYAPVRFILKMSLSPFSPKYNICHIHFF